MIKHLKGIDTLRALAAIIVVWGHIELIKSENNLSNILDRLFLPDGRLAVILFFVISGFLITYLLVKERDKTGTISYKKFYMRRILRIWPLYYFILLISFLIFREEYSAKTIALCLTIFPNVAHAIGSGWTSSPQIWSIGVEEQFYLFWPLLFMLFPKKKTALFLLLFFVGYPLMPHLVGYINLRTSLSDDFTIFITNFFYGAKFNCMGLGALLGLLYANKSKYLRFIDNKYMAYGAMFLSLVLWFSGFSLKYFTDEFYSILFAISLYNIVVNPKIKIDNFVTVFLGKISYGIYMYHWIIILLLIKYLPRFENYIIYNLILYILTFGITIIVAWLSFNTIERYFLTIKKKFEVNPILENKTSKQ